MCNGISCNNIITLSLINKFKVICFNISLLLLCDSKGNTKMQRIYYLKDAN